MFHRVYLEPSAYDHFLETGRFPEGTMLALTIRLPERRVPPSRTGWTEGELVALEMSVKDTLAIPRWVGLLRLRHATPTARPPSRPSAAPRATRSTRRSTTSSCSSIPSCDRAEADVRARLAERGVVRYAMRQSRPILLLASGPPLPIGDSGMPLQRPPSHWTARRHARSHPTSRPPPDSPDSLRVAPRLAGGPGRDHVGDQRLRHGRRRQTPRGCTGASRYTCRAGTEYRGTARAGGAYSLLNMRVGGPYRVTASMIGFQPKTAENVHLNLGETQRVDLELEPQVVELEEIAVTAAADDVSTPSEPAQPPSSARSRWSSCPRSSEAPAT